MLKRRPPPLARILRHPWFKSSAFMGLLTVALPGGSLLGYSHFVETRWLKVARFPVRLEGLTRPLRLLHISDLHFTRKDKWARGMIEQLNQIECDVAVITGDLVMPNFDRDAVRELLRALPHPPLGLYMAPGNWEYWAGLQGEALETMAREADIELLLHRAVELPGGLTLAGIDDELAGTPEVELVLGMLPPDRPAIVLSHCPSLFPKLDVAPVRLVLSGHTHGGQVRLPFKGAVWLPNGSGPYDQGWFEGSSARLFVNRGFGTSLARMRFMCRPEAALLELEP